MLTLNSKIFIATTSNAIRHHKYYLNECKRFRRYIPVYLPIIKPKKIIREERKAQKLAHQSAINKNVESANHKTSTSQEKNSQSITHFTPLKALQLLRLFHKSLPNDEQSKTGYITLKMVLKIDTTRTSIRGSVLMPHPIGTVPKVLAICDPVDAELAIINGAKYAGLDVYIDKIASGWMDFDRIVCTPQYMPQLLRVARILGPAKLMPTFKSGTLVTNLTEALQNLTSSNSLQYRTETIDGSAYEIGLTNDPHGEIIASIGMLSQSDAMLLENISFFTKEIAKKRPLEDVKKSGLGNSFDWPPSNFISPKQRESRHVKLERIISMIERGNAKSMDLSTFFVSASLEIPNTPVPPVYTRII